MIGKEYRSWLIALVIVSMLGGCRAVADQPVVEERLPVSLADLLPESTALVVSVNPEDLAQFLAQVPGTRSFHDRFSTLAPPVIDDLLKRDGLEGRDWSESFYVALATTGQDELMKHLRLGAPISDASMLPQQLHFRLILPALNSVTLADSILSRCETRRKGCGEFVKVEAVGSFVTVDLAMVNTGAWDEDSPQWATSLAEPIDDLRTRRPADSLAFRSFESGGAVFAVHTRFSSLYDLLAIDIAAAEAQHSGEGELTEEQKRELVAGSVKAAKEYLFDSPDTAEFEDVTLRLENDDGVVTLDMIMTLTDYGQHVTDALEVKSAMASRTLSVPALDVRWGFALSRAIAATERPNWAQDTPGMAPEPFANMMDWKTKSSEGGFALAVMRSPVTGYALFDKFVGSRTTPAEFAHIRGFWMQLGVGDAGQGVATLGLDLPVGADVTPFEEFANLALLPFGMSMDSRSVDHEESLELQAATGGEVGTLFETSREEILPRITAHVDLHQVFAFIQALDDLPDDDGVQSKPHVAMISPAVLPAKYRNIWLQGVVHEGHGLLRIQFGDDALRPYVPTASSGVEPPHQVAEKSPCLYRALEWSILAAGELDQGDTQSLTVLAEDVAGGLDELAAECAASEPEAAQTITWIAEQWRKQR